MAQHLDRTALRSHALKAVGESRDRGVAGPALPLTLSAMALLALRPEGRASDLVPHGGGVEVRRVGVTP